VSGSGLAGAGETQSGDAQPAPVPLAFGDAAEVGPQRAEPVLAPDGETVDLLALPSLVVLLEV
jgi:hypothetical protein